MARRPTQNRLSVPETLASDFAFIHINKCGGTSVEQALGLPKIHDTARQRRRKIGRDRWAAIPTFALVRHPYAKVASHYRYRLLTNQTGLKDAGLGLNDWVRRTYGDRDPRYFDKPLMFAPCMDWLTNRAGQRIVDLVVRLEDIDRDWPRIERLIGRTAPLPRANSSQAIKATANEPLDATSRAILDDHFRQDFQTLGYDPDDIPD